MRVCHPVILASAGTASFCLIIAAESHDKAWGTEIYIYICHKNRRTPKPHDQTNILASAILRSQHKSVDRILSVYRPFPSANKTLSQEFSKALPEEQGTHSIHTLAPIAFTTAEHRLSRHHPDSPGQAWESCYTGLPQVTQIFWSWAGSCRDWSPAVCEVAAAEAAFCARESWSILASMGPALEEWGVCLGQVFLGDNETPVLSATQSFPHRYFCLKAELGVSDVWPVTEPPFKT